MNFIKKQFVVKLFMILSVIFAILTFIGAYMVITDRVNNAGYSVIPMIFTLIFGLLAKSQNNK